MEQPEKIATGYRDIAGPVFSRRGYLLFSDVPSNRILKWEHGKITVYRENSHAARSNTFDHQGRLLTCETGRVVREEKSGSITVLAAGLKEPADLVYAIDGSVYFTDPPAGAVYQITRHGNARPVARDCEHPAGVALAPNQQQLFVADRAKRQIRVYGIAPDGALSTGRTFATCDDPPAGLKTDESGAVWVACNGGIRHFGRSGEKLDTIAIPEPPSNCNWGEGFSDLYLTAKTSVYKVHVSAKGTRTF